MPATGGQAPYFQCALADLKTTFSFGDASSATQDFTYRDGKTREVRSQDILTNRAVKEAVTKVETIARKQGIRSFWLSLLSLFLVMLYFGYKGRAKLIKRLERGSQLLDAQKLTQLIKKQKFASDLNLDGLPLIKNKETSHILVTGTTGSGKLNCFHTLLPQIRARGDRALIVDLTGELEARYLTSSDLLLNPFDERSQNWTPWADCPFEPHYDQLAAAIVPPLHTQEIFWQNAAKVLLSTALQKTKDTKRVSQK